MDCLYQLIILLMCLLLVVASRYNPQHEERLNELEKWPFTTTTPLYSYKELTSYPFQTWKPATTTENPQKVLAQMFKAKEISDMREPPKVNKNPLMFQNYEEVRQTTSTTQKPNNRIKNTSTRNTTRSVTTNRRTSFTTTTNKPLQTTTIRKATTTNSPDSIVFKDNEQNTTFGTPQRPNATYENNTSNSNNATKANITSDEFGTRLRNQDTKLEEVTTVAPEEADNITVALNPADTIQAPNQAVVIQAINPAIPVNPTLNTANIPQYILGNNQLTLSTSSAVNQPTLYTIVTVPNSQQQIIVQSSAQNSIPQNPLQIDIKNTAPNADFVQNKEQASVSQLPTNNQQYILLSSPNQQVSQVATSSNQLMVIQVPNNQYQVSNNQMQVPNNQYQVSNQMQVPNNQYQVSNNQMQVSNQYQVPSNQIQVPNNQYQISNNPMQVPNNQMQVQNNQYQVPNNQYQVPNNQIQVPNNQIQIPNNQMNLVQSSGNVPMVLNNRMQDTSASYILVETPKPNSAHVSNNVPYTNTVMVSISG